MSEINKKSNWGGTRAGAGRPRDAYSRRAMAERSGITLSKLRNSEELNGQQGVINMIRITIVSALLVLSATAQTQQPANPDVPANLGITIIFQELNAKPELLHAAQLAPEDERATAQIVAEFVKTFRAYGRGLDRHVLTITDFILMRNDLVQKTRARLRQRLTNAGWLRLDAYISRQMKHIRPTPKARPSGTLVAT